MWTICIATGVLSLLSGFGFSQWLHRSQREYFDRATVSAIQADLRDRMPEDMSEDEVRMWCHLIIGLRNKQARRQCLFVTESEFDRLYQFALWLERHYKFRYYAFGVPIEVVRDEADKRLVRQRAAL